MLYFLQDLSDTNETSDFTDIMNRYGNDVLRMAYLYVKSKQKAEDICQDVFVMALIKKAYEYPDDKQKAWLIKVTVNACKNYVGSYWNRNVYVDSETINASAHDTYSDEVDTELIRNETKKTIIEAIHELPPKYRLIIILYYYQELNTTQIAKTLGLPRGTVKSRFARAKELLEMKFQEDAIV